MLKRICDRCGQTIVGPRFYDVNVRERMERGIVSVAVPESYELCGDCIEEIRKFMKMGEDND